MVAVHRAKGYRCVIYTNDHEPAHLHVTGPGHARIDLGGPDGRPRVMLVAGIGRGEMRRLLAEVEARQEEFLAAWRRIHGAGS
jgi:hypothetical protein